MEMILSKDEQLNLWDFSVKLSKSQMVPKTFFQKPEDVFVTVLYGKELGMSPIVSLNSLCVIQGQVTLKVNTMTGIILKNHPKAVIDIKQDESHKEVVITFKRDPSDPAPYVATWNMEKAKALGLAGKANYQSQPLTMLRARALSEGYRIKFGDTLLGFYSSEEMEDLPPLRNETPAGQLLEAVRDSIDQDFPIPKEEKEIGPLYRFQNSIYRGKQLFQLTTNELQDYLDKLNKRTTPKKQWESEIQSVLTTYLENIDTYRDMILELQNGEE
jgi:hypothetical protein